MKRFDKIFLFLIVMVVRSVHCVGKTNERERGKQKFLSYIIFSLMCCPVSDFNTVFEDKSIVFSSYAG